MRAWWVLAVVLGGCGGPTPRALLDWSAPVSPTTPPASSPPALHVDGTVLRDPTGAEVRLRGVNVCSLEFDNAGANWRLGTSGSALLATLADPARWNVNVVRVPVNQQWFLEDPAYVARVEALIDDAAVRGVYVVLDDQWERAERTDPYFANILSLPTFGEGNTTEAFWHAATSRFANRTNVLFDLINEPHDAPFDEVLASMQVLTDAIRRRNGDALIVIGGPDWAHSLEPWSEHPLQGANLVYSAHEYPPYDPPERWQSSWIGPAKELPVLVGEFLVDPAQPDYATQLVDAAEAAGVNGWMPWAIGCGFEVDDDLSKEPLTSLAAKLRALNP